MGLHIIWEITESIQKQKSIYTAVATSLSSASLCFPYLSSTSFFLFISLIPHTSKLYLIHGKVAALVCVLAPLGSHKICL